MNAAQAGAIKQAGQKENEALDTKPKIFVEGTTPLEFVLWLNGAADLAGECPTPEQWKVMKEKLGESMGYLAKKRFLQRTEDLEVRDREDERREKQQQNAMFLRMKMEQEQKEAMAEWMKENKAKMSPGAGYAPPVRIGDMIESSKILRGGVMGLAVDPVYNDADKRLDVVSHLRGLLGKKDK